MQQLWAWISDPKNQKTLALLGTGLAAACGAAWTLYSDVFKSSPPSPVRAIENACGVGTGGRDVTITGITCSFGISLKEYEAALAEQEKKLRAKLQAAPAGSKQRLILEQDLSINLERKENLSAAYKERSASFAELGNALEEEVPGTDVNQAFVKAVETGDTSVLEERLRSDVENNTKLAAHRSYQLGLLLRQKGELAQAYDMIGAALKLAPDNKSFNEAHSALAKRLNLVLGKGKIRLSAALSEGGTLVHTRFQFYDPKKDLDGNRRRIVYEDGIGKWFTLPAGQYLLTATSGSTYREQLIDIVGDRQVNKIVNLNAGQVRLTATLSEGGTPVHTRFQIYDPKKDLNGNRRRIVYEDGIGKWFTLPAGRYLLTASSGSAYREKFIDIVAGQQINDVVNLNAAQIRLTATLSEGGTPVHTRFQIYDPKKDLNGNHRRIVYEDGIGKWFTLNAGRYLLTASSGSAYRQRFIDVVGGQQSNESVNLNAAQLRFTAVPSEGADPVHARFEIYAPEKDLDGNRRRIIYEDGIGKWFTLNAGRYFVRTSSGSKVREQFLDVVGGKQANEVVVLN